MLSNWFCDIDTLIYIDKVHFNNIWIRPIFYQINSERKFKSYQVLIYTEIVCSPKKKD